MNERALKVLEYYKIKEKIKAYTETLAAKDIIDELKPYNSIFQVKKSLDETKEAFKLLVRKGTPPFGGLYDVREEISKASKGSTLLPGQLLRIANMLRSARKVREYILHKEDEEVSILLEDIAKALIPMEHIERDIFIAIIGENEISDKASTELYNIRKTLKIKNSSIKDRVNNLLRSNSKYLQENLYTIRGDRYVIPVKAEYKNVVKGLVHDQSSTGATLFIEPLALVNLNNEIKELMLKEKAEIDRILRELSGKVYNSIVSIKNNSEILFELDFIFAKAKYASELNCICPRVNERGVIDLINARHPLISPKEVVSITVHLGKEFESLVITGPNTGGKTVTLKTVGLLELMAMSGIMIPAKEGSVISMFSEIFADIGDEQSIEQSLSTFSAHMTNIVNIIEEADNSSLALFDELGAGTDPTEGAALAVAILENLKRRGTKLIATTHYSEIKAYALRTDGVENASVEFDIETLKPTYRLLIGVPGKSNAFEISKRLGLHEFIINAAKESISNDSIQFEDLIQELQEKSIKAKEEARKAEQLKLQAEKFKEKYEKKYNSLEKVRENALVNARREAKALVREAKEEADRILKDMRELERMGYSSEARRQLEEKRKRLKDSLENVEETIDLNKNNEGEVLETVKEGDIVFLPSLNQVVTVISNPDNKGEVTVQAGIMKVNVSIKNLRKANKDAKPVEHNTTKKKIKLNLKAVSTSVDLRGMDSEEAMFVTDKYLDDAYLGGLKEVTIIHGKGTGILRNAISDMLKTSHHVKSYRLGNYGEGGTGVTVVQLK